MVAVDETYIGGEEPELRGGRAKGKKVLTAIAVEVSDPRGFGRCRMAPLTDASGVSLETFVTDINAVLGQLEVQKAEGESHSAGAPLP